MAMFGNTCKLALNLLQNELRNSMEELDLDKEFLGYCRICFINSGTK
jgi:hypothetical protein